jgi:hypothetical protein
MIVVVDLAERTLSLDEPDDLKGFAVSVADSGDDTSDAAVGQLFEEAGVGGPADEADHVWVSVDTVRLLAADQVDDTWSERFEEMLAYAGTKGWLDEPGSAIKAHIERL